MLPGRGRALRLEQAQLATALYARWALADRLGHGERHLSRVSRTRLGYGASLAGRHRRGDERFERHGAGHLDVDDAGGGRDSRPADRAGEVPARRYPAAEGASTR